MAIPSVNLEQLREDSEHSSWNKIRFLAAKWGFDLKIDRPFPSLPWAFSVDFYADRVSDKQAELITQLIFINNKIINDNGLFGMTESEVLRLLTLIDETVDPK